VAFLPALYAKSEIRNEEELRVADVDGIHVVRNHALVWRNTSPASSFYRQLSEEIKSIIETNLSSDILPASLKTNRKKTITSNHLNGRKF